jgi:hypothetical protein
MRKGNINRMDRIFRIVLCESVFENRNFFAGFAENFAILCG